MRLKVKKLNLTTSGPLVAILNKKDAKALNIDSSDRITLKKIKKNEQITCVVNITSKNIKKGEIGLFEEPANELKIPDKTHVNVSLSEKPESLQYIKLKLEGKELDEYQIDTIIRDILENKLSEIEMSFFIASTYPNKLSFNETVALTKSIINNSETLNFKDKIIIDKHCIGGIPGNRTTPIIVSIIASLGYKMPKTSSRSITSPSGTADTMEVLTKVSLPTEKIKKIVKKTNGCFVWGGAINLAAADDKLIKIRHPLSLDPKGMLLASILAKKKTVSATHILIDIPFGKNAKVTKIEAKKLKKNFLKLGKELKLKIKVILTDGSQPIGNGIGPALEASDIISVLKGKGPRDLREKSIYMSTEILKMLKVSKAKKKVLEVLNNGTAYLKFREIIKAQGGLNRPILPLAKHFFEYKAKKEGTIKEIHNKKIAKVAKVAGAPEDKTAGIYLRVKNKEKVKKNQILFTIYAESQAKLDHAIKETKKENPISY
jgi:putative thymidine phosphorylase